MHTCVCNLFEVIGPGLWSVGSINLDVYILQRCAMKQCKYIYIFIYLLIFRYIKPDSCLYDLMVFLTWEHNCHRIVAISWEVPYKYVTEIVQGMYKRTNSLRN